MTGPHHHLYHYLLILLFRVEPFLLDPRHVEHVRLGQHGLQRVVLLLTYTLGCDKLHDVLRHPQRFGADVAQLHVVECQQPGERVDRAAVLQVPAEGDRKPVDRANLLTDREDVEKRLRWVLACAIACVYQRLLAVVGGFLKKNEKNNESV